MKSWKNNLFTINYSPLPSKAFTLAEVLITLGTIGIVAAMTIPILMNNIHEQEFKTRYKKAYSVLSQALQKAQNDQTLVPFSGAAGGTGLQANFLALQQYFSVVKVCDTTHLADCWDTSSRSDPFKTETTNVYSFIDKSGMVWRMRLADNGGMIPMILVDINGYKGPNKYGQDRFPFQFSNTPNNSGPSGDGTITGVPTKIVVMQDTFDDTQQTCPSATTHPCYYTSWLYN